MLDLKSLNPFHHKTRNIAKPVDAPREHFRVLRQEMDHLFDSFFNGNALIPLENGWSASMPKLAVTDGESELTITAELPGMEEKDVDVNISGDLVSIEGEKREESEKSEGECTYSERSYGKFSRTVRLPFSVKDQKVDATFDKGVLTIQLEKPAEQQKTIKHVEIKRPA